MTRKQAWANLKRILKHKYLFWKAAEYTRIDLTSVLYHDLSSFYPKEFKLMAEARFNTDGKELQPWEAREEKFAEAWKCHLDDNAHHWQNWLLENDRPRADVPQSVLAEAVTDWMAIVGETRGYLGIASFWKENRMKFNLHPKVRLRLDGIVWLVRHRMGTC